MTGSAILGIDPGLSGALALFDIDGTLEVLDVPVQQLKTRRAVDEYALARIIDNWAARVREVWLEMSWPRPGEGGPNAFTQGQGYGIIRGICAANFLTIIDVSPQRWKRALKLTGDKDESRRLASTLMPRHGQLWPLKKHDGRAEAALIALHGSRETWLGRAA